MGDVNTAAVSAGPGRFGETLSLFGLRYSIGSIGNALDNALTETTVGLCRKE